MKKVFLVVAIGLILTFNLSAANQFVKKTFFSPALNQDKTYFISYPDGYDQSDTTKKFPVIIFLHGAGVNAQDIVDKLEPIFSNTFAKLLYPNFYKVIFVIPDGSAAPYMGSFYTNSELYGNFETYIATDLYNEVHEKYYTYYHREKWAIMGHSMGGYGSMKIALKYPDQFIGEASLSGPLDITYYNELLPLVLEENGNKAPYNFTYSGSVTKLMFSMAGAFSPDVTLNPPVRFPIKSDGTIDQDVISHWKTENPINLIRTWKGNPNMALFIYCGEKDEYKLLPQNKLFSDTLSVYNIVHTYVDDPTGDHVNSLLTSFPQGLNFLCNVMDTAQIKTNLNSVSSIQKQKCYIYPNPAKDFLNFSFSEANDIQKVNIISITGSTLKTYPSQNLKYGLDISGLKPGCYLLSVRFSDGRIENYNFIKAN
jgi:S-formylglutathione hydrolase FrmB